MLDFDVNPRHGEAPSDWRDFSSDRLTPPLRAARDLFAKHGYHATSIRAIAEGAGLSVPGLYYHFESKQAILQTLVMGGMSRLLEYTHAADSDSDGTAVGRFNNVVECLLLYHLWRRENAFVASSEMRSMESGALRRYVTQRDEQQRMITEIIEQGLSEGTFRCKYVREASRAVASLCISVSGWYHPDGALPATEIAQRYLEIARRIAGVQDELAL